jgi:DNA-binding winged helix-turn-helix (wHTH) protein
VGTNEILEFRPYRISVAERVLRREGRIVPLTPKCFDTLLVLAKHGGSVVEKETLMRMVWPDSFVEEGNLAQNIFTLRKALGETPDGEQFIQTIPKRGYRLTVPVAGGNPAELVREVSVSHPLPIDPAIHRARSISLFSFPSGAIPEICGGSTWTGVISGN